MSKDYRDLYAPEIAAKLPYMAPERPDWTMLPPGKPTVYYYIFRMLIFLDGNHRTVTSVWALTLDNLLTFDKEKEIMEKQAMEVDKGYIQGRDMWLGFWNRVTREEYKAYIGEGGKDAV